MQLRKRTQINYKETRDRAPNRAPAPASTTRRPRGRPRGRPRKNTVPGPAGIRRLSTAAAAHVRAHGKVRARALRSRSSTTTTPGPVFVESLSPAPVIKTEGEGSPQDHLADFDNAALSPFPSPGPVVKTRASPAIHFPGRRRFPVVVVESATPPRIKEEGSPLDHLADFADASPAPAIKAGGSGSPQDYPAALSTASPSPSPSPGPVIKTRPSPAIHFPGRRRSPISVDTPTPTPTPRLSPTVRIKEEEEEAGEGEGEALEHAPEVKVEEDESPSAGRSTYEAKKSGARERVRKMHEFFSHHRASVSHITSGRRRQKALGLMWRNAADNPKNKAVADEGNGRDGDVEMRTAPGDAGLEEGWMDESE